LQTVMTPRFSVQPASRRRVTRPLHIARDGLDFEGCRASGVFPPAPSVSLDSAQASQLAPLAGKWGLVFGARLHSLPRSSIFKLVRGLERASHNYTTGVPVPSHARVWSDLHITSPTAANSLARQQTAAGEAARAVRCCHEISRLRSWSRCCRQGRGANGIRWQWNAPCMPYFCRTR
jgi:hypothetical protein